MLSRSLLKSSSNLIRSRARNYSINRTLHQSSSKNNSNYIPLITISACAITSASMYYYFMNRVKNESESKTDSKPIEIIEIVEEVVESIPLPPSNEQDLEDEAKQEGAFNEETGEINWDCPCLGGMAHGPCGEEFKMAFSCFVYSKEEPKGIECIEKFKNMQDCFRKYPEVYSDELRDEENLQNEVIQTERAVDQAVMNNDIIESVEDAIIEVKEIKQNVKKSAIDLYSAAQKKIDDFHKK
jgi:intermembrane space import and assembly protein 40